MKNSTPKKKDGILFRDITGDYPGLKEDDFVILEIGKKIYKYIVHTIEYLSKNKFKAKVLFISEITESVKSFMYRGKKIIRYKIGNLYYLKLAK